MRLSTDPAGDEERGVGVLRAVASGAMRVDTADAYRWRGPHERTSAPRARIASDPVLAALTSERGVRAYVLTWLDDLGAAPPAGATRIEHAREDAAARTSALHEGARHAVGDPVSPGPARREPQRARRIRAAASSAGEVVLVIGIPGAGKSTRASAYVERGYVRLNRDERGGTLRQLAQALDRALEAGARRVMLDNTYGTRASRREIIEVASRRGVPVRCVWLDTPIEQAQINAVWRILERYGRLLSPQEMARTSRRDPNVFDPRVQNRYRRAFEPPEENEGFVAVERVPFVRKKDRRLAKGATIVSLDAFVETRDARVVLDASRAERLRRSASPIHATSWAPSIDADALASRDAAVRAALGVAVDIETCTHPAGPPICWCRKPLPGLALVLMARHGIDPARSQWVGTSDADRALAANLGFTYVEADAFFSG